MPLDAGEIEFVRQIVQLVAFVAALWAEVKVVLEVHLFLLLLYIFLNFIFFTFMPLLMGQ